MREYTIDELAGFTGKDGSKAFIAYNGKVYDVSKSEQWDDGDHMGLHGCGEDLTESLDVEAPHDVDVLDNFTQVGILKE